MVYSLKPYQGMAFSSRIAGRTDVLTKTFAKCLSSAFDPIDKNIATNIISAYEVDINATGNSFQTNEKILNYGNDIMFSLPAQHLAQAWSMSEHGTQAFLGHFNCPNPWDGPWKGYSTHIQDIAFVLQNYNQFISEGQRLCAERYAKDIIAFVTGEDPWPAVQEGSKPGGMVYYAAAEGDKDESEYVRDAEPQRKKRRDHLENIVGVGNLDRAVDAWVMFMAGGPR
jgi:hypothetical protein